VGGLGTGIEEQLTSDDELAILKEFEAADQAKLAAKPEELKQPMTPTPLRVFVPPQKTTAHHPAERLADPGADLGVAPPEPPRARDGAKDRAAPEAT
jgi:hypothetical protein